MKTIRKMLAVVGIIAIVASSMTGCGKTKTTEVQLLTWSNPATVDYLNSIKDAFHEAYPQYELVVTDVPTADNATVTQTRLIAKDVDIISLQGLVRPQEEWNASFYDKPSWQEYVDDGLLMDLTDEEFMQNYNQTTIMSNAYNDRLYSVVIGTVAYTGVFYNKAIFEELGLEVPNTWDEFMAVCEAVKADGKYEVLSCGGADTWPLTMQSNAIITANYREDSEEIMKKLATGELKHTDPEFELIYDCIDQFANYLEEGTAGIAYADAPGRFALGDLAMYADGSWSWSDIDKANPEFEYGYFPIPGVEAREDGLDEQFGIKYDLSFSVPTDAPNSEGALAFLEFISRKDVYSDFINAIGFSATQDDVALDNEFLNSLSENLQKPVKNAELYSYSPKGVGEFGAKHFSFNLLKQLGGEYTVDELAELADQDYEAAFAALESLDE